MEKSSEWLYHQIRAYGIGRIQEIESEYEEQWIEAFQMGESFKERPFFQRQEQIAEAIFQAMQRRSIPQIDLASTLTFGLNGMVVKASLEAILFEIEKMSVASNFDEEALVKRVAMQIKSAVLPKTLHFSGVEDSEKEAILNQVKAMYLDQIQNFQRGRVVSFETPFYRQVLQQEEANEKLSYLQERWLNAVDKELSILPEDVLAKPMAAVINDACYPLLKALFSERGISRLYELDLWSIRPAGYEIDLEGVKFYGKTQACWAPKDLTFAIYKHHEGMFYFCGVRPPI